MAESKLAASSPNDGEKSAPPSIPADDRYKRQQSTLQTLAGVGTLMAGVESQILTLTLSLDRSKLRTVSMSFAVVAVINTSFTSLYSTVMHSLYRKTTDEKAKGQGSTKARRTPGCTPGRKVDLWVTSPRSADMMIIWCGTFLVVGTCAGFIALVLYFFASSSIGVGIFVVMIVFAMGVCPMIWILLSARGDPDEEKHASARAFSEEG
ncbi:hypothetical protein MSAN_00306600 [Mycena sanguinolenta]|uniref:Transmembrane protein n=1 Tax=Mycena sanguinolenta TaxID=230812 RepID=A0A8H6ZAX7_9AGAR|nr:hypothetical protein MSAN_00306600 [Mycena sanguinolenta]